tara:strand:+ start:236244 stop:236912 length:669 start_codon:yes stop_codon:yes gene_type:complete
MALENDLEIDNLPNRLTIFRVILIPIVIASLFIIKIDFLTPFHSDLGWIAAWTFSIASITDFFDGYIARKRNIVTVFGSFLDPIADKFLTVSSLIMLQALDRIPAILVIILVLREMYMTSLRLLATNEGIQVPVSQWGKWKTALMMIGIPMLMANEEWWIFPFPIMGIIFIYLAAFLSLWSAVQYSMSMVAKLKLSRIERKEKKEKKNLKANHEEQPSSHNS